MDKNYMSVKFSNPRSIRMVFFQKLLVIYIFKVNVSSVELSQVRVFRWRLDREFDSCHMIVKLEDGYIFQTIKNNMVQYKYAMLDLSPN